MPDLHSSQPQHESPPDHPPAWIAQVLNELQQLSNLPANWDSYGAAAPNKQSIQTAQDFVKSLSPAVEIEKPQVSITANGTVAFQWEWSHGRRNLDVELLPDGTLNYAFVDEEDESREEEGQTQNAIKIIEILTRC
jgi:hypothetical protein